MKVGDLVTIAEGDYAGEKVLIVTIFEDFVTVRYPGETATFGIQKAYISQDDEVKRIWMVFGDENKPTGRTTGMGSHVRRANDVIMPPRVKHTTKESAMKEMDSLAKKFPNKQFYLLESVAELRYEMELTKKEIIYD